jgi:hypothetical protein
MRKEEMKEKKSAANSEGAALDESYWLEQIDLQEKSQLSKTVYCQVEKISYTQFVYWSNKLGKQRRSTLVPVEIMSHESLASSDKEKRAKILCKLNLKNGKELEVYEEEALLLILGKVL